jgi:hypothetical protein
MSRKTRDVAGILHFLTPQQMAEEIVRLDAALSARSAEPVKPEPFPRRFLKAIKEMADPEKCWEYGDGDPMADDAALAVQWIEARAALNAAHVLASPTDDYDWKAEALKHRDRLTRIGRTMVPEGSFFWDDITEGAVKRLSSPPPIASPSGWMNAEGRVCSAAEKHSMENHQGFPGKRMAATFTTPLYASPPPLAALPQPRSPE